MFLHRREGTGTMAELVLRFGRQNAERFRETLFVAVQPGSLSRLAFFANASPVLAPRVSANVDVEQIMQMSALLPCYSDL